MRPERHELKVGLLGFGTVGRAVAASLAGGRHARLRLAAVCTRRAALVSGGFEAAGAAPVWSERFEDLLRAEPDVVVEAIGGLAPAREWVTRALEAGCHVVTANKQLVAEHGSELAECARRSGRSLRFEAAVCGAVPVLAGVRHGLAADRLTRIVGVLNGTSNFVLTRMERGGIGLDEAVAEAQERGFAEADPSADIDGLDARAKVAILAAVGLGASLRPADIPVASLRGIGPADFEHAATLGRALRQISSVERVAGARVVRASVGPALVPATSWLASGQEAVNVVIAAGENSGSTLFAGQGAGGPATAVAVVSDLLAIAAGGVPPDAWPAPCALDTCDFVGPHYVRVPAGGAGGQDVPAALAASGLRPRVVLSPGGPGTGGWAAVIDRCTGRRVAAALAGPSPAAAGRLPHVCLPLVEA